MLKSVEISMLRAFAAKLGQNSYCGPWLNSIADEVESQLASDFFPAPTLAGTRKDCDDMLALAKDKATQIEADAQAKADRLMKSAEQRILDLRNRTAIAIRRVNEAAMLELEGRL
jgi:cell division septum initiation protein DivIVA